jgi:hypothetical protein
MQTRIPAVWPAASEPELREASDMKKILLALCITAVSFPALAIQRYNVQTMSCASVQNAVNRDGAAILRYRSQRNPSLPLYDRYVRNGIYCDPGEYAERAYVPTRDNKLCPVRKCAAVQFNDRFD